MKTTICASLLLLLLTTLVACGQDQPESDLGATVEALFEATSEAISDQATAVARAVEQTIEAMPTGTPEPSSTPIASPTFEATATLAPTSAPPASETPLPVPDPTDTSEPPTVTPSATPVLVVPAAPPATTGPTIEESLLASMREVQHSIQLIANDQPRIIYCSRGYDASVADNYEFIINAPTYDVTNASGGVRTAYAAYRQAISIIQSSNRNLYDFCISWISGATNNNTIPFQTWGIARDGVTRALNVLNPAIEAFERSQ